MKNYCIIVDGIPARNKILSNLSSNPRAYAQRGLVGRIARLAPIGRFSRAQTLHGSTQENLHLL